MPAPKVKTEDTHIHNWIWKNQVEAYCSSYYKGKPCIAIKVGTEEYQRRIEEWDNYYEICQSSNAKLDYEEMRLAVNGQDLEKIAEIKDRIQKRKDENDYLPRPEFADPMSPYLPYAVEGI